VHKAAVGVVQSGVVQKRVGVRGGRVERGGEWEWKVDELRRRGRK